MASMELASGKPNTVTATDDQMIAPLKDELKDENTTKEKADKKVDNKADKEDKANELIEPASGVKVVIGGTEDSEPGYQRNLLSREKLAKII